MCSISMEIYICIVCHDLSVVNISILHNVHVCPVRYMYMYTCTHIVLYMCKSIQEAHSKEAQRFILKFCRSGHWRSQTGPVKLTRG